MVSIAGDKTWFKYDDTKETFFFSFNKINPDRLIAMAKHIDRSSHNMLISHELFL